MKRPVRPPAVAVATTQHPDVHFVEQPQPDLRILWIALLSLGVLLRLAIWWLSIGSNDIANWVEHAKRVLADGLAHTYANYQLFNHPPLMGLWSAWSWAWANEDLWVFSRYLKLPALAGEAISLWALWRYRGPRNAAVYACMLPAILVASFHGNSDALCAAFTVMAALTFDRNRYLLSGVLWGAALNVKLMPIVLLPAALLAAPDRKAAGKLALGIALALLPFAPFVIEQPAVMYRNLLAYNSNADNWGILAVLNPGAETPRVAQTFAILRDLYLRYGRYFMCACILTIPVLSRFVRRISLTEQTALGAALFLLLAPGFGIQYLIFVAPVLCAVDIAAAIRWAITAGVFAAVTYWIFLVSWYPAQSVHTTWLPGPAPVLGFAAWMVLLHFVSTHLIRELRHVRQGLTRPLQRVPSRSAAV